MLADRLLQRILVLRPLALDDDERDALFNEVPQVRFGNRV